MAFERFSRTFKQESPCVTFWAKGRISFNAAAKKTFRIEDYKYAVIFFDKESYRIGIKLTNCKEEGALQIKYFNHSTTIPAEKFLRYYNLCVPSKQAIPIFYDEKHEMIVFSVSRA